MFKKGWWKKVVDGMITFVACGLIGWVVIYVLPNSYQGIEDHIYGLNLGLLAVSSLEQVLIDVMGAVGVVVFISAIVLCFSGNNIVWWIWAWAKKKYALVSSNRSFRQEVDNSL